MVGDVKFLEVERCGRVATGNAVVAVELNTSVDCFVSPDQFRTGG